MIKDLIYNSEIKNLLKKPSLSFQEANLIKQSTWSESQIQQACRNIFLQKIGKGFIQIDNGGKMSVAMKMKKKREGTVAGMVDVMLITQNKIVFVEFKRIGSPSQINPSLEQKEMHQFLSSQGFTVYVINNTAAFERMLDQVYDDLPSE